MKVSLNLWSSRVGRTLFLTFLLCSVAPLILQSFLAERWVESQLIESAEDQLAKHSGEAQMALVESIQRVDHELSQFAEEVAGEVALPAVLSPYTLASFAGFGLSSGKGSSQTTAGEFDHFPRLSAAQQEFVDGGQTQLFFESVPGAPARLYLIRQLPSDTPGAGTLFARLRADFFHGLLSPDSELLVIDLEGETIFTSVGDQHLSQALSERLALESHGGKLAWEIAQDSYLGSCKTVFMRPQYNADWRVLYSRSKQQILAPVAQFRFVFALVLGLTFLIVILASLRQLRKVLRPLMELGAGTERFAKYDFEEPVQVQTSDEFGELAQSFNAMGSRLKHHMRIERELHALGLALGGENDSEKVIEMVLGSLKGLLGAEHSLLFLSREEGQLSLLDPHQACLGQGEAEAEPAKGECLKLPLEPAASLAARAVQEGKTLRVSLCRDDLEDSLADEKLLESASGFDSPQVLCTPLYDHDGDLLGVLQVGRSDEDASLGAFEEEEERLFEAIAAQASMALSKNQLIADFRGMMMSMTEVFAMAVDEKSPYTGAHCRRVPEVTMMLAESAKASNLGSLVDFQPTKEELFELEVASLLHDCGKVVTPVHVMDKATKLETIHDRISSVELRFEILERDARIAMLEANTLEPDEKNARSKRAHGLSEQASRMRADLEFLRQSNKGTEFMPEEDRQRVAEIAKSYSFSTSNGEQVPLLNDEELENLTIPYGTLNQAERKTINDHIVFTIRMLESLKYPKGLGNVPILAGAHHERMDGKGYPYGLTREEIPVGGRIMGIADVFEALTDNDRPYKEGKTLQEALNIMGTMAATGHLDSELFRVFVDAEVYLRYAEQHMAPERYRFLDLGQIPGYVRASDRGAAKDASQQDAA